MFRSSPARRTGSEPGRALRPVKRWAAVVVLALGVAVAASACRAAVPPPSSDEVAGPEWRTDVRRSPGAATRTSPAALTGVSVQPYHSYDRVVFTFAGDRPGYRVTYEERATGLVLKVTIIHVQGPAGQRLVPEAEAVSEVIQPSAGDLIIDAVVKIADGAAADVRPPFRVGLDVGKFYVDIGHRALR
jgi:hypothetical protein